MSLFSRLLGQRLVAVVDLTLLLPGGMNGGIRPAVFALLRSVRRALGREFRFVYLTNTWTHHEIGPLRLAGDQAICISRLGDGAVRVDALQKADRLWFGPPADLVERLSADVFYCPLCEEMRPSGGVPVVVQHVDLLHRDFPDTLSQETVARRERFFAENVRRAAAVQTISEFSRERIAATYPVAAGKLFVTKLALKRDWRVSASRELANWQGERRYFVYPANFWRHKNHYLLIDAYATYSRRVGSNGWRLALTGDPSHEFLGVMERIKTHDVQDQVRHWGHLPEADYTALIAQAGALVFPSHYEGFGIPLLEAMDAGVPIVASDRAAIPEVCAGAARLLPSTDTARWAEALEMIAGDAAERERLSVAGRRRAADFALEPEAERLAMVFRRLARGGRSAGRSSATL